MEGGTFKERESKWKEWLYLCDTSSVFCIRNEARVNEDLDQKSLLRKYERELKKLRAELEERSKNVVDKRRLLELDDQVK